MSQDARLQYLFDRAYAVALKPPDGSPAAQYGNLSDSQSALRVAFEIEKGVKTDPNKAKITLFNLNRQSRAAIGPGYLVLLRAGYLGLVEKLFVGVVSKVTHTRSGPDITTALEATDGQAGLLQASFNRDYPKNTPLSQVLSDIGQAMSVDAGVVIGLPDERFTRGLTLHGSCSHALKKLCGPRGLEASVQNGKLNILPQKDHLGTQAIVISPDTGMIGIPSATKDGVDFDALLNPKLTPGQLVQIISADPSASGFFKIRTVKIEGDTFGDKWQVSCQTARLPQAVQTLAPATGFSYGVAVVPGLL